MTEPGQGNEETREPGLASYALSWALHDLSAAGAELDPVIAKRLGLSTTDYTALKHLMFSEHSMGPVELGKLLGVSSGSATAIVDRLQHAGYVQRRGHPDDRRRLVVVPTERANDEVHAELSPLIGILDTVAAEFSAPHRDAITEYLRRAAEQHRVYRRHLM